MASLTATSLGLGQAPLELFAQRTGDYGPKSVAGLIDGIVAIAATLLVLVLPALAFVASCLSAYAKGLDRIFKFVVLVMS